MAIDAAALPKYPTAGSCQNCKPSLGFKKKLRQMAGEPATGETGGHGRRVLSVFTLGKVESESKLSVLTSAKEQLESRLSDRNFLKVKV